MNEERKSGLLKVGVEPLGVASLTERGHPLSASWLGIRVDFSSTDDEVYHWDDWKKRYEKQLKVIVTYLVSNGFFIIERIEVQDNLVLLHTPSGITNIYKLGVYEEAKET